MNNIPAAILSLEEIRELCPDLEQPGAVVRYLRQRGFVRAELRSGQIVLERPHFQAVCEGRYGAPQEVHNNRPKVKPPRHA